MIRCFLISLVIVFVSCASQYQFSGVPVPDSGPCVKELRPVFKADLYNTTVDVVGKHISGLLLFKNYHDTLHVVFMSEAGLTFFDFEFHNLEFRVRRIQPMLDHKGVIRTLRRDFELVTMTRLESELPVTFRSGDELYHGYRYSGSPSKNETDYFVTDKGCTRLLRMEIGARRKKTEAHFSGQPGKAPDSISVRHFNFDMAISMKKLDRSN